MRFRVAILNGALGCASLWSSATRATPAADYAFDNVRLGPLGFIDGIVAEPRSRELVARTDVAGAYRWDEASARWIPICDFLIQQDPAFNGVESIALDPSNPGRVYLAAASDVYRSDDLGATWNALGLGQATHPNDDWRSVGERLAVDPNAGGATVYFGSRDSGLFVSPDFGSTWARVPGLVSGTAGRGVSFVLFDSTSGSRTVASQTVFAGVMGAGVFVSRDAGSTWSALAGQPSVAFLPARAALASDGSLFVSYLSGTWSAPSNGAVYRYRSDSGTQVTPSLGKGYDAIAVSPVDPLSVVVATFHFSSGCELWRSTDGGTTWSQIAANASKGASFWPDYYWSTGIAALAFDPIDPSRTWVSDGFSVYRSDDNRSNSQTFTSRADGIEELVANFAVRPPGGPLLVGVEDVVGFTLDDVTKTPTNKWEDTRFGGSTGVDFQDARPKTVVRVGGTQNGDVYTGFSDDGGVTWTPFGSTPPGQFAGRIALSANDPKRMVWVPTSLATGGQATPLYSVDRGTTWHAISAGPTSFGFVNDYYISNQPLAADRVNGNVFYLYAGQNGAGGAFYRSQDGGVSFSQVSATLPDWYMHALKALPGVEGDIWMSFTGAGVSSGLYRSVDGGVNWQRVAGCTDAVAFGFGKAAPGQLRPATYVYGSVAGERGLFRSDDATSGAPTEAPTWTLLTSAADPLPHPTWAGVEGDRDVYGRVYVATGGRGVFVGAPSAPPAVAGSGGGLPDSGVSDGSSAAGGMGAGASAGAAVSETAGSAGSNATGRARAGSGSGCACTTRAALAPEPMPLLLTLALGGLFRRRRRTFARKCGLRSA